MAYPIIPGGGSPAATENLGDAEENVRFDVRPVGFEAAARAADAEGDIGRGIAAGAQSAGKSLDQLAKMKAQARTQANSAFLSKTGVGVHADIQLLGTKFADDPVGFQNAAAFYKAGTLEQTPSWAQDHVGTAIDAEITDQLGPIARQAANKQAQDNLAQNNLALRQTEDSLSSLAQQNTPFDDPRIAPQLKLYDNYLQGAVASGHMTAQEAAVTKASTIAAYHAQLVENGASAAGHAAAVGGEADSAAGAMSWATKNIMQNPALGDLTPAQREQMNNRAMTAYRLGAAGTAQMLQQQRDFVDGAVDQNVVSLMRDGTNAVNLSDADIASAYRNDPTKAQEIRASLNAAAALHGQVTASTWTPQQHDATTLTLMQPGANAGFAYKAQAGAVDQFGRVLGGKWAALQGKTADPAQYVLSNDGQVAAQYRAARSDPTKMPEYVQGLDARYDQLGIPQAQRSLLPKADAAGIVSSVASAPSPQRAGMISQMQQQYGPLYSRALGDLVKAGLPRQYEVLTALPDPTSRQMLAQAIGVGRQALEKALPKTNVDQIETAVRGSSAMQSLTHSLASSGAGAKVGSDYADSVTMLALQNGQSMTPSAAANAAVQAVTGRYNFWANGSYVARLPATNAGAIKSAASSVIASLKPTDLAPLSAPASPGVAVSKSEIANVTLKNALRGSWVTNENDTGLVLMGEAGNPVMRANGSRVEYSFKQLAKMQQQPSDAMSPIPDSGILITQPGPRTGEAGVSR
jgi:hypothetical protein